MSPISKQTHRFLLGVNYCKALRHSCFWESWIRLYRSSHQRCSVRKVALKNFANFTGKHLCQSLFLNKVADLRPATLLKKRLWLRCFRVNFAKFLRTPLLKNTSGRLLLPLQCLQLFTLGTPILLPFCTPCVGLDQD